MPKITVINLCYNSGNRLIKTLQSFANQTFKDFEVIIIDDASSDNSVSVLEGWIQLNKITNARLVKNKVNVGIPSGLNRALKEATGDYISVIGDDLWDVDFLEQLYIRLNNTPANVGMIYCKARRFNEVSQTFDKEPEPPVVMRSNGCPFAEDLFESKGNKLYFMRSDVAFECLFWSNYIASFTFLAKKSALIASGGYDETYSIEDYPMWFRITKKYDLLFLDEVHATYVRHATNFSTNNRVSLQFSVIKLKIGLIKKIKDSRTRSHVYSEVFDLLSGLLTNSEHCQKLLVLYLVSQTLFLPGFKFKRSLLQKIPLFLLNSPRK
ncbi:MAG: glycosyltransferase family 2 protein [Chitinophagaceae bacterium]|jgi:glycosyltransferase involved in cell wall biosynthesis|nr:glycosyltransferase family 2 protein [Chitinophagaceae bacterium]